MSDALSLSWASMRKRQSDRSYAVAAPSVLLACAVALLTFGVYLATMAPGLYTLDSPELTTAAYKLGIAHAPGYPLYTLVGWAFSHAIPVGSVAFRMNMLSGVFGSIAAVAVYALCLRVTARPVMAAAAAMTLAFSYHFWANALIAEVYTLDAALFAGMLLAAIEWRRSRTLLAAGAVGLLVGLSLATRTTSLLYLPALLAFAVMVGERDVRAYGAAGAGLIAGLAFYLYLPIRSAMGTDVGPAEYAVDGTRSVFDLSTWSGFWNHVTASSFQSDAFAFGPVSAIGEAGVFVQWLTWAFVIAGLPLGLMGIARLWRADRQLLVLLAGAALPVAAFYINYGAIDKEFMFLPVYVVWAVFVAAGLAEAFDAAPDAWKTNSLLMAAPLLLPVVALGVNMPRVSLHGDESVRTSAESALAGLAPNAIVFGPFMDVAPLEYLQSVEGVRTDVQFVNTWTVDEPTRLLAALAAQHEGRGPLYVTRDDVVLPAAYQIVAEGDVYRVTARAP